MFRSIRWTLLFWYAVILVSSLTTLGWVLLGELERRIYEGADQQLAFWLTAARSELGKTQDDDLRRRIGEMFPPDAVFTAWDADGTRLAGTGAGAMSAVPEREGGETRGHFRVRVGRHGGGWLLVGMNVEVEHHRVRDFLYLLLTASSIIVVIALGGGWLLVSRALAPVDRIARTARRISGSNLGERIDATCIKNELAGLASTLNESFDRLEDAVERQARFTADASHELRTPLAIVSSHLELAETEPHSEAELRERIAISREAARRMRSVVEGLLTLARADAGEATSMKAKIDLRALLDDVRASIAPLATARQIRVLHRFVPGIVRGDPDRLREAFTNLYTNAVRHSPVGGEVHVALELDGGVVVMRVTDHGPGIPKEHLPHIFERFYRVDPARSGEGSGLGLAITRWNVECDGGSIEVASPPGAGAEFIVRLPADRG